MPQIRVNQQDRVLTVSGERAKPEAASSPSSDEGKARWERRFGTFKREVTLPESADLQAISAKCVPLTCVLSSSTAATCDWDVAVLCSSALQAVLCCCCSCSA